MRRFTHFCALAFAATLLPPALCSAQLIGDTVVASRYLFGSPSWGPLNILVQAGPTDAFVLSSGNNLFVDIEANSINIDFGVGQGGGFGSSHYLLFADLDYVGDPTKYLTGVLANTNNATFFPADLSFGPDWVRLNIGNASFNPGEYYDITLIWVPAPGALALLGLGGMMACRRRRR